ncbi:hypothetical protein [Streptomyces sp. NPDC003720]|uniref:hypothetical protein n=1 Tax=Streptomyces sp. NPDC003720 TaxID=3364684 RepID=UPI0036B28EEC
MLPADRIAELLLLIRVKIVGLIVIVEVVSEDADKARLVLADGGDGALQSCRLPVDAVASVIRRPSGFERGYEMAAPIEAGDPGREGLLANPATVGIMGKPRLITMFIGFRLAGLVGDPMGVNPNMWLSQVSQ